MEFSTHLVRWYFYRERPIFLTKLQCALGEFFSIVYCYSAYFANYWVGTKYFFFVLLYRIRIRNIARLVLDNFQCSQKQGRVGTGHKIASHFGQILGLKIPHVRVH